MLIKAINTKNVGFEKTDVQKLVLADEKASHFLFRIAGEADACVSGKSRFKQTDRETGEVTPSTWIKFAGEFIAMNNRKEEFESAIAFLPNYIAGPIAAAVGNGEVVSFAFDIFAVFNKDSATSYEYVAKPLRGEGGEGRVRERLAALSAARPLAIENKGKK